MIVALLANWKTLLVAAVASALVLFAATPFLTRAGRNELLREQALAAANIERERVKDDARLRNLSDRDLCLRALGSRGLPNDCSSLLGLP